MKPVVNVHDTQPTSFQGGDVGATAARIGPIGEAIGSTGLGALFVTAAPGKHAFPSHNRPGIDEMFIVLEGTGSCRFGGAEFPVETGDVCRVPRGRPEMACQLINTGTGSTRHVDDPAMNEPEVVENPESEKNSALPIALGTEFRSAHLGVIGRNGERLDCWEGELRALGTGKDRA